MQTTPRKIIERLTTWIGSPASLIVHTVSFLSAFSVSLLGLVSWETILLVVTTIVSLEAIYLAIFIQMTVNRANKSLHEVEEDVAEIERDIGQIEENIHEISDDIEGIEKDVADIEENIDEVTEDIEELQEDIEEMTEEDRNVLHTQQQETTLEDIAVALKKLLEDVEALKRRS